MVSLAAVARTALLAVAGSLVVASLVVAAWWVSPRPAASVLKAHHASFVAVTRTPVPELGPRLERWTIRTSDGDALQALFRAAHPRARAAVADRPWAVVLLGGIDTGDRAALLLPDALPMDLLALDWPWHGPHRMTPWEFARRLPEILEALHRTPSALANGVEALRQERGRVRVALLGASLGAPVAAATVGLARVDALVLVDGMADLRTVFDSELRRRVFHQGWLSPFVAPPLAALAARLTRAFEPREHAAAAAGLPVLILDAEDETRFPAAALLALHRGYPHATRELHPGGHMRPRKTEQLRAIVRQVSAWLVRQPRNVSRARGPRAARRGAAAACRARSAPRARARSSACP